MLPLMNTLDSWSGDKAMEYFNVSVLRTGPSLRDSRSKERIHDHAKCTLTINLFMNTLSIPLMKEKKTSVCNVISK